MVDFGRLMSAFPPPAPFSPSFLLSILLSLSWLPQHNGVTARSFFLLPVVADPHVQASEGLHGHPCYFTLCLSSKQDIDPGYS